MLKMRLDRGQRNLRQHELARRSSARRRGQTPPRANVRKQASKRSRLIGHAALQRRRPVALNEIVPAIEHEQPGVVEMSARPSRRVERSAETVARLDRGDETLLIGEHGLQPQFAEQRVARGEAIVERALGAFSRSATESTVTASGPRSAMSSRAAARKPA